MSDFFFRSVPIYGKYTTFAPTTSWGTTNVTGTANWYQLGENVVFNYKIALSGAPISSNLTLNLPLIAGVTATIDQNKLLQSGTATRTAVLGTALLSDANGAIFQGGVAQNDSTSFFPYVNSMVNGATYLSRSAITQAAPFTFASGDDITIQAVVPITGMSV